MADNGEGADLRDKQGLGGEQDELIHGGQAARKDQEGMMRSFSTFDGRDRRREISKSRGDLKEKMTQIGWLGGSPAPTTAAGWNQGCWAQSMTPKARKIQKSEKSKSFLKKIQKFGRQKLRSRDLAGPRSGR
ncbi:hypothetical protein BDFG_03791 [Blastomyces dermatitidis ATCC 26199]|nr:hypothetical protein BDFG_03791 [Blastomyces dermatitidis ATCC 26199]